MNDLPIMYCWPFHWLQAAVDAGFAQDLRERPEGCIVFHNPDLRVALEKFAEKIEAGKAVKK